jgi:hypothetical protein
MNHTPGPRRSRWRRLRNRARSLAGMLAPDPQSTVVPRLRDYPVGRDAARRR